MLFTFHNFKKIFLMTPPHILTYCLFFKKVVHILCGIAPVHTLRLRVPLLAKKQTSSEWVWLYE